MSGFPKVWFQTTPPRASMVAFRDRRTGRLVVGDGRAEFRSGSEVQELPHIRQVTRGRAGSDFFNSWIRVEYGEPDSPSTAYLNDGGWLGWRPLITRTNERIAEALQSLIE